MPGFGRGVITDPFSNRKFVPGRLSLGGFTPELPGKLIEPEATGVVGRLPFEGVKTAEGGVLGRLPFEGVTVGFVVGRLPIGGL